MLSWVIKGELARSSRPGYGGERGAPVAREVVDAWLADLQRDDICAIICLLGDDQLHLYDDLPGGLIPYYVASGFPVRHILAADHQQPHLSRSQLDAVWEAYSDLPKPVVIHCSAGIDRTGSAVDWIVRQLSLGARSSP